ncbi:hypothetical protein BJ875DRAFT_539937 [Amylocarpus encephaloides]|uniref:Uncharacterized protein n=1 Tax=Amylocarpus encephaloides TaxID=45428 RepID=A0A9P7YQE7_9HELO|nr:hypothetical protein BJ875DRAFT_539937 [Amylocarpus encephaloides]
MENVSHPTQLTPSPSPMASPGVSHPPLAEIPLSLLPGILPVSEHYRQSMTNNTTAPPPPHGNFPISELYEIAPANYIVTAARFHHNTARRRRGDTGAETTAVTRGDSSPPLAPGVNSQHRYPYPNGESRAPNYQENLPSPLLRSDPRDIKSRRRNEEASRRQHEIAARQRQDEADKRAFEMRLRENNRKVIAWMEDNYQANCPGYFKSDIEEDLREDEEIEVSGEETRHA